jgi:hypothetical protein
MNLQWPTRGPNSQQGLLSILTRDGACFFGRGSVIKTQVDHTALRFKAYVDVHFVGDVL